MIGQVPIWTLAHLHLSRFNLGIERQGARPQPMPASAVVGQTQCDAPKQVALDQGHADKLGLQGVL